MQKKEPAPLLQWPEFIRLTTNFYNSKGFSVEYPRLALDSELINYVLSKTEDIKKKYKVALCFICVNPPYWQYALQVIAGAKQLFLPGHDVDYFLWSDMPSTEEQLTSRITEGMPTPIDPKIMVEIEGFVKAIISLQQDTKVILTPLDGMEWPMPTLMRYSIMLQQEAKLKDYDYVFYCDIDMRFDNVVGDEVLGEGWTAAEHPGYSVDKRFVPPYEPNKDSAAYIPRPGTVIQEDGKPRFKPLYFAGGFQGATAKEFILGAKTMKKMIDKDFRNNYTPIWNDESIFNRYLFDNPPSVVLNPGYVYPDSLINEYYIPLWGRDYPKKIVTLTKPFTVKALTPEEQEKLIGRKPI